MDKPNNSCYKRVYVGDMAGSTLTVNGKPIVNNIDDDTVVGFDVLDIVGAEDDVFGNKFHNVTRYVRSTLGEYDSNGKWVTKPAPPHEDYKRYTYTPELVDGKLKGVECANPTGDSISSFESPLSCSKWVEPDSRLLWIRHDKDCKPVDTENPNEARSVYKQRDHIRTDYGRLEDGKWVTKPTVFIDCVRQDNLRIVLAPTYVGDYEFTYENGVLIAREEGYTDYLEPENNTVIYS